MAYDLCLVLDGLRSTGASG